MIPTLSSAPSLRGFLLRAFGSVSDDKIVIMTIPGCQWVDTGISPTGMKCRRFNYRGRGSWGKFILPCTNLPHSTPTGNECICCSTCHIRMFGQYMFWRFVWYLGLFSVFWFKVRSPICGILVFVRVPYCAVQWKALSISHWTGMLPGTSYYCFFFIAWILCDRSWSGRLCQSAHVFNTLRPKWNESHFVDSILVSFSSKLK